MLLRWNNTVRDCFCDILQPVRPSSMSGVDDPVKIDMAGRRKTLEDKMSKVWAQNGSIKTTGDAIEPFKPPSPIVLEVPPPPQPPPPTVVEQPPERKLEPLQIITGTRYYSLHCVWWEL